MKKNPRAERERLTIDHPIIASLAVFVLGFGMLQAAASLFIREVTHDLAIESATSTVTLPSRFLPQASLTRLDKRSLELSDYFDRPFILSLWVTWNKESVAQLSVFDDARAEGRFAPDQLLAVSSQEDPTIVQSFVRRGGYEIDIALDLDGSLIDELGARTLPATFLVDTKGRILEAWVGYVDPAVVVDKLEAIEEHAVIQ